MQKGVDGDIISTKDGAVVVGHTQAGAFYGALDPDSLEASQHGIRYYEAVREMKNDVLAISQHVGWSEESIQKVKQHVFLEKHDLGGLEPERFDPDYNMAVSWQRLVEGKDIKQQDITLLKHEYLELTLMQYRKLSYRKAHTLANQKHNYKQALKEVEP